MKNAVDKRRADIKRLVWTAIQEASLKHKKIETIDMLVVSAKRLFPYLHEETIYEYARTALRVIKNSHPPQTVFSNHQTTLLMHLPNP